MTRALRDVLNESNQNKIGSADALALLGDALALIEVFVKSAVTANIIVLPTNQKAIRVVSAFVTAGGATGYFIPDPTEATPGAGHVTANQLGNIEFAAADAVTAAEVTYLTCEGDLITETIQVAASVGTLNFANGARKLLSAQIVTGVTPGATPIVDVRSGAAPAAGHCQLGLLGTTIAFNAAQVVAGTALVTYIGAPGTGAVTPSLAQRLASLVAL